MVYPYIYRVYPIYPPSSSTSPLHILHMWAPTWGGGSGRRPPTHTRCVWGYTLFITNKIFVINVYTPQIFIYKKIKNIWYISTYRGRYIYPSYRNKLYIYSYIPPFSSLYLPLSIHCLSKIFILIKVYTP